MGKKLVIKGADFSENGFVYELVKKEITALYNKDGDQVTTLNNFDASKGLYFYEKNTGNLTRATYSTYMVLSTAIGTTTETTVFPEVEDFTDVEITTVNNLAPQGVIAGVAVLFFLNSSKQILGGFSTGDSQHGCQNVGASSSIRTFSMKVPEGAVYLVASVYATVSDAESLELLSNFKITLSKKVIQ